MLRDLQFAGRLLLKNRTFSVIAVLTLAIALGATTTIFTAVEAVLLNPLPYSDPDSLVIITENLPHYGLAALQPSFSEFLDYRKMARSFSAIAAVTGGDATLTEGGQAELVSGKRVTSAAFSMLGVTPILGSLFSADDEQYGTDHVVILSEGLWKRRYGGDRKIIGKNVQINRESYRVSAVIHSLPDVNFKAELWVPLAFPPGEAAPGSNGAHAIDVIGRLKPGISLEQARDEFRSIAARMIELHPNQDMKKLGFSIDVKRLAEEQAGDLRKPLWLLIASVGAVMFIACANISSLLLARGRARRKEVGIRVAVGIRRSRLVRQFLTESVLLALVGDLAGLVFAFIGIHIYTRFAPRDLIPGLQPAFNGWVLLFSFGLSIITSVFFGLAPAVQASGIDVNDALKETLGDSTRTGRVFRESIVGLEVASSLVLLIGVGLLLRSFIRLERTNPGFNSKNVVAAVIPLPISDYPHPSNRIAFEQALLERVRTMPGVMSAGASDFPPYMGGSGSHIEIAGHAQRPGEPTRIVYQIPSSSGYLETMNIPLMRGRRLSVSDDLSPVSVCDIDEIVVRNFFPANSNPVGVQVVLPIPKTTCTIVGLVGATKSRNLAKPAPPKIYYSSRMPASQITLVVKTATDPSAIVSAVRHQVAAINSNLPVTAITMDQILADSLARQRFSIHLMALFAAIAAALTAVGIYGVLAYLVDLRRRELSIRITLGAQTRDIVWIILRQGSVPVVLGFIFGIIVTFAVTRYLRTLLYEISVTDPVVFTGVFLGLAVVALLAMSIPAYRATRVDPAGTVREV